MKTTRIYYDTEFLEGTQDIRLFGIKTGLKTKPTIDLISIGMVKQTGEEYYAISKDFNLKEAWNRYDIVDRWMPLDDLGNETLIKTKVYWIRENVLKPIWKEMVKQHNEKVSRLSLTINHKDERLFTYKNMKSLIKSYGKSNKEIAAEVIKFCTDNTVVSGHPPVELYGYYSAYDHVVLAWLFGKMIDLPPGFPMYTKDLKQIFDQKQQKMDNIAEEKVEQIIDQSVAQGAMFFDRTEYNLKKHPNYPKQSNEHSAIHDAKWNKQLHEFLNNL